MKKLLKRTIILTTVLLPLMTFAHFMVFPQETRCMFISFSDLKKTGNLYYSNSTDAMQLEQLLSLKATAEKKFKSFWGKEEPFNYKIIFCNTEALYNKYGNPGTPATTQRKLGAYVVLSGEGLDENIIAHELSHTILYNQIGWYKASFKIPTWFEEGLAMQVDDRERYAIDSVQIKMKNGLVLPNVNSIATGTQFYNGNSEAIRINYVTSKYVVHEWLKTHSLKLFIQKMNNGDGFEAAFKQSN